MCVRGVCGESSGMRRGTNECGDGAGGSGVVILKVPDTVTAAFSGGVTSSSATSSGYNIYTITAAGVSDTVTFS